MSGSVRVIKLLQRAKAALSRVVKPVVWLKSKSIFFVSLSKFVFIEEIVSAVIFPESLTVYLVFEERFESFETTLSAVASITSAA